MRSPMGNASLSNSNRFGTTQNGISLYSLEGIKSKVYQYPKTFFVTFFIILAVIILIILYYTVDKFKQMVNKLFNIEKFTNDVKDLDIIFFMDPSCADCMNTIKALGNVIDMMTVVNIKSEEGQKFIANSSLNIEKVPQFISGKLRTGLIGPVKSTSELINNLTLNGKVKSGKDAMDLISQNNIQQQQQMPPQTQPQQDSQIQSPTAAQDFLRSLQLILIKSNTCSHCNKALNDIQTNGLTEYFTIIEANDPNVADILNKYNLSLSRGVPLFYSVKTGRDLLGYGGNIEEIINKLSQPK